MMQLPELESMAMIINADLSILVEGNIGISRRGGYYLDVICNLPTLELAIVVGRCEREQ